MYQRYCINQETNIHLFILAVYCVPYFFQNITKTFPNSTWTQNVWLCSDFVSLLSRHTLYSRMWRIFRYMLSHSLSNLRTITRTHNNLLSICFFACLPSWISVMFCHVKSNYSLLRLNMITFPKSALASFDMPLP